MINGKDKASSEFLIENIVKGIQEKKGGNISILNLKQTGNAVADFFVLCNGNSDTQIAAIAESIEKEVFKNTNQDPWHKEGFQNKEWALIDYIDVVVHIFKKNVREFYALEELWGDAVKTVIEEE